MPRAPPAPELRVCAALLEVISKKGDPRDNPRDLRCYDAAFIPACSLESYLSRFARYTESEPGIALMASIYVDRVCKMTGLVLASTNIHRLLFTALLLASKWSDDRPFRMSHYAQVGGVSMTELKQLEEQFLGHLQWDLCISPTEMQQYETAFRRHPAWGEPRWASAARR